MRPRWMTHLNMFVGGGKLAWKLTLFPQPAAEFWRTDPLHRSIHGEGWMGSGYTAPGGLILS